MGDCLVGDIGGADCWVIWVDIATARDDKLVVEGIWYGMPEVVAECLN